MVQMTYFVKFVVYCLQSFCLDIRLQFYSLDHPYQDHVMRCENPSTIYQTCPKTERLSLFVPLSDVNPVGRSIQNC